MNFVESMWYEPDGLCQKALSLGLMPFTVLFALISASRRSLYKRGLLHSSAPAVPVVIIGGITVGGSGKTPLCIALLQLLRKNGWHPGLLSRGYKGKSTSYPLVVGRDSDVALCGDEPLLIKSGIAEDIPVVVDPRRERGAFFLARQGCDIILCDDGMQHYALKRDAEVAVLDGVRRIGNGRLLPSGPLRESADRLKTTDLTVVNGGVCANGEFSMCLKPSYPRPLDNHTKEELIPGSEICALAGIGNPSRFYATLTQNDFKGARFVIKDSLQAGDHMKLPFAQLQKAASKYPVIMTAKDAVKYRNCGIENLYVLEVEAVLSLEFEESFLMLMHKALQRAQERMRPHE